MHIRYPHAEAALEALEALRQPQQGIDYQQLDEAIDEDLDDVDDLDRLDELTILEETFATAERRIDNGETPADAYDWCLWRCIRSRGMRPHALPGETGELKRRVRKVDDVVERELDRRGKLQSSQTRERERREEELEQRLQEMPNIAA